MLATLRREAPFLAAGIVAANAFAEYVADVIAISADLPSSMAPRVLPGDVLLVIKQPFTDGRIRRGDVVQYVDENSATMLPLLQRLRVEAATIMALLDTNRNGGDPTAVAVTRSPDERSFMRKLLFSDPRDVLLGRVWAVESEAVVQEDMPPCKVPAGALLLGAECWDDEDDELTICRACQQVAVGEEPGLVTTSRIVGRVAFILWPLDRIGRLPAPLEPADGSTSVQTPQELMLKLYGTRD